MQSPNSRKGQTSVVQQCWIPHSNWWWCDDDVWLDTYPHFHSTPDGRTMKPRRVMKMCRNGVANRPCTEFRTESDVKWPTRWQCASERDLWSGGGCTLTFELRVVLLCLPKTLPTSSHRQVRIITCFHHFVPFEEVSTHCGGTWVFSVMQRLDFTPHVEFNILTHSIEM